MPLRGVPIGDHALEAWLVDAAGGQLSERHTIGFNVATQIAPPAQDHDLDGPNLLQWMNSQEQVGSSANIGSFDEPSFMKWKQQPQPLLLVIGIKSSTSPEGFRSRQSLRQTWFTQLPRDVRAWFILGKVADSTPKRAELTHALEAEQRKYGDLLLGEVVDVQDSYYNLVPKVLFISAAVFALAATTAVSPHLSLCCL
jgi:hypothetical protein